MNYQITKEEECSNYLHGYRGQKWAEILSDGTVIIDSALQDVCVFCMRSGMPKMHGHHVVPKAKGGKEIVPTCGACGSFIHATWSHNELRDEFNTVEKIRADERFQKYLAWLKKQQPTAHFKTLRNNDRAKGRYK